MALLLDRRRRAGRFLEWKVGLLSAGAVLGLAGVLMDEASLRIAGIAALVGGMLVRLLPGGGAGEEEDDDDGMAGSP